MSVKIKVLLADDTLIAREGWKRILETAGDMEVVAEAKTASETERLVREFKPDVLLMDLQWFGDDDAGWVSIIEIKKRHKVRVIAVTAYENLIKAARRAGADSALLKTFSRDELLNEIREQYARPAKTLEVSPFLQQQVVNILTDREMQVLQLLGDGHSDKEIAKMLTIALATAKNHVKKIIEKLEAKNRTHAVSIAREMGILN